MNNWRMDDKTRVRLLKSIALLSLSANIGLIMLINKQQSILTDVIVGKEELVDKTIEIVKDADQYIKKTIEVTQPSDNDIAKINQEFDLDKWNASFNQD